MSNFAKLSVIASLVCATATAAAAQVPTVDWKKQEAEILRHHRALIQIDTSPPSHETKVDDYLKRVLEAEGIPVKTSRSIRSAPIWSRGSRATARSTRSS